MAVRYDWPEIFDALEVHVAIGGSLDSFCSMKGRPNKKALYMKLRTDEGFEAQYERAIKFRALEYADKMDAVVRGVEDGSIDPSQGRVLLQGLTHMMDRFYHRMFGDKSRSVEVKVDLKDALEAARQRVLEAPTIEGRAMEILKERSDAGS